MATAAAQVATPYSNTCSCTQQLGVPPPTCQPGYTAAVMKQQQHQRGLMRLTCCITRLENKVHQAMAVRQAPQLQIANEQSKTQKKHEPVSSQQIWVIGKWHWRAHQNPHQHYQVHLPTQGAGRLQERHHLRAVCMLGQTQKCRTQPNVIHGRG